VWVYENLYLEYLFYFRIEETYRMSFGSLSVTSFASFNVFSVT